MPFFTLSPISVRPQGCFGPPVVVLMSQKTEQLGSIAHNIHFRPATEGLAGPSCCPAGTTVPLFSRSTRGIIGGDSRLGLLHQEDLAHREDPQVEESDLTVLSEDSRSIRVGAGG
jgi:hypothetical protein